jgi:hypothetical protein
LSFLNFRFSFEEFLRLIEYDRFVEMRGLDYGEVGLLYVHFRKINVFILIRFMNLSIFSYIRGIDLMYHDDFIRSLSSTSFLICKSNKNNNSIPYKNSNHNKSNLQIIHTSNIEFSKNQIEATKPVDPIRSKNLTHIYCL